MKRIVLTVLLFSAALSVLGMEGSLSDQVNRPMELQQRLFSALLSKGILYKPRTEHLNADGSPIYINRLILEDSPYLLQHAHNPVDWYPWGTEAFEKAKRENKPIFLSIGYSTCHWCHVMERESFENIDIAKVLNEHFVAIKVDRESLPQVDETYMTAVLLITGHGGWPLSSFLTPNGRPFFGGTYYPPQQFIQLLQGVIEAWQLRHDEILQQAQRISEAVNQANSARSAVKALDDDIVQRAVSQMLSSFDEIQGGFGQAPKFPHEPWLFLLLNQAERRNDGASLKVLETTLDAMARGGIYDQIGGGFHRYSTDNDWLVPHFEKMLYNQAHLARIYLHAWRLTGKEKYRRIVVQTLDYVLREMTNDGGAFYSATDADSEGEEGAFFIWTPDEIRDALPSKEALLTIELYGVTQDGNFEGMNILHLGQSLEAFAERKKIDPDELRSQVDKANRQLWAARNKREHPLRDDKIVTAWNGMMISALARAGQELDSAAFGKAAEQAATFLWRYNHKAQGKLWRVNLNGRSSIDATLEDYAYLAEGLLHLYDLNQNRDWLQRAAELADAAVQRFSDDNGVFFLSEDDNTLNPMGRPRDGGSDNAIPSGSSVMLRVLQMLTERTGEQRYRTRADRLIAAHAANIEEAPSGYGYMLTALDDLRNGELSAHSYVAHGDIRLSGSMQKKKDNEYRLTVELDIPEGWHINAHQPLNDKLIPTEIELKNNAKWTLASANYPDPVKQRLEFQPEPLLVYQGMVHIQATINGNADKPAIRTLPVTVQLQACNDKTCLPPETKLLTLSLQTPD